MLKNMDTQNIKKEAITNETREKLSLALRGNKNGSGKKGKKYKPLSEEHKLKLSLALKGRTHSEEHNKKVSLALKGREFSKEWYIKQSEAHRGKKLSQESIRKRETTRKIAGEGIGEKNGMWKADGVGYGGLHKWVRQWLGKPNRCEHCGKIGYGLGMHWANIDHSYKRNLNDWLRLCAKCHKTYDSNLIKV